MSDLVMPVRPGAAGVLDAIDRVRTVLDGGRSVALVAGEELASAVGEDEPQSPSIILTTSGSTGQPRGVEIDRDALIASARRAEERIGGAGLWLTAIPITGAGGLNTVVRSLLNGHEPIVWGGVGGASHFDGDALLPSLRALRDRSDALGVRAYTSLVPTQVSRLVSFARADDRPSIEALHELARLDAVLIGADALSSELRIALGAYGIHFIHTYGATETCGGCIFDDRPFDDTKVDFEDGDPGRIVISGPTVAWRYRDDHPDLANRRWRSNDIGRWRLGHLELLGRTDDVVKVGGTALALPLIANAIRALAEIEDVVVLARQDPEWGHVPVAFVVHGDVPDETLRKFASTAAGRSSLPFDIIRLDALPLLPNGKVDRQQLLAMVE